MDLNTQFKLYNDPLMHRYIRENSYWYKILNRNPLLIDKMKEEMKDKYKLTAQDKIENLSNKISMLGTILKVLE